MIHVRIRIMPQPARWWRLATIALSIAAMLAFGAMLIGAMFFDCLPNRTLAWVAYGVLIAGWTCGEVYRKRLRQQL